MKTTERHTIPPADRVAIVDALYRFGAGQDLHDRQLSKQDERWLIDRMQIENA